MTLRAKNVSLVLGDGGDEIKALDDVSLEVAAGELAIVLGP